MIPKLPASTVLPNQAASQLVSAAAAAGLTPVSPPGMGPLENFLAWVVSELLLSLATQFTLNAGAGPLVASAGDLTPVSNTNDVTAQYSGVNGSTLTVRTAAQMIADAGLKVGQTYRLRIINTAAGTLTLTTAAGVTLTGHVAILTNTGVDYVVTVTGAATMTFQSVGTVTAP
jgi:hypothetical protein